MAPVFLLAGANKILTSTQYEIVKDRFSREKAYSRLGTGGPSLFLFLIL